MQYGEKMMPWIGLIRQSHNGSKSTLPAQQQQDTAKSRLLSPKIKQS
jgi:hypothetical protein